MKKIFLYTLFGLLLCTTVQAQLTKRNNTWYFGTNTGLNFNNLQNRAATNGTTVTDVPTLITNGPINTIEGSFVMADVTGSVLFSSDGSTVYNSIATSANSTTTGIMSNGTGLFGDPSGSQAGIVIPFTQNPNKYYVISVAVPATLSSGVDYSIVDLSVGTYGSVITKNIKLKTGTNGENITAIPNATGDGYWLVHRSDNVVSVWVVKDTGITFLENTTIPAAAIGGQGYAGYTTASTDYKKIAFCSLDNYVALADFNNKTGKISNIKIRAQANLPGKIYRAEFSPSNKWLFMSCSYNNTGLFATDLSLNFLTAAIYNRSASRVSNIQRHLDGRLYGTSYGGDKTLYIVMNPDVGGTDVRQIANFFGTYNPQWGLPNFPAGYVGADLNASAILCSGNPNSYSVEIRTVGGTIPNNLEWDFGDGSPTISVPYIAGTTTYKQLHSYATAGDYTITIRAYNGAVLLSSSTLPVKISSCHLQSNRMIRVNLANSL